MEGFAVLSRHFTLNGNVRYAEVLFEFVLKKTNLIWSSEVAHQSDFLVLACNSIELIFQLCASARSDDPFLGVKLSEIRRLQYSVSWPWKRDMLNCEFSFSDEVKRLV